MKNMSQMMERCMRFMKNHGGPDAMEEKFGNPMEMCNAMMGEAPKDDELAAYATPELRSLFEDWLLQLEEEIITFAKDRDAVTPDEVANAFKISGESAGFVLEKLAREKRIDIDGSLTRKEDFDGNDE